MHIDLCYMKETNNTKDSSSNTGTGMSGWFVQHRDGVCFRLDNATGFRIVDEECHIFYNGAILHPTLTIKKSEYPDKFSQLRELYDTLADHKCL